MNNIAIVGATTNIGRKIVVLLAEYGYLADDVILLDDHEFEGKEISFGNSTIEVECMQHFNFKDADIVIFCLDSNEVTRHYCEKAKEAGCLIIDTSSTYRYEKNIPLIIPEINGDILSDLHDNKIISCPSSITIQTLLAVKSIKKMFGIKRLVISTYQAVSGNGKDAMDELFDSTKKIYENDIVKPRNFIKPISFNVIPQVGDCVSEYEYSDEYNVREDINKIYNGEIKTSITSVNVPVFNCHSETINVECRNKVDLDLLREVYEDSENIMLLDNVSEYVYATPKDCSLDKSVFISRLREDSTIEFGINMWVVSDNLLITASNILGILKLIQK